MISVLVIEDDTQISRLIESTLTAEGYHCECALDGQIGADCIEEKVYDLILLDLMLPQISGYELLEYIVTVGTPVIIISAMGQVKDRIRGLRMGADDYLSKPFQIGELLARVETVLRRTKRIQDKITIDDVTLKALSDPARREILQLLKNGRMSAGEIGSHFHMTGATVSYHLKILKKADLIWETKEKNFIYYDLNTSVVEELLLWLKDLKGDESHDEKI